MKKNIKIELPSSTALSILRLCRECINNGNISNETYVEAVNVYEEQIINKLLYNDIGDINTVYPKGCVYALYNPITNRIFYVGATRGSLKKRLKIHIATSVQYKRKRGLNIKTRPSSLCVEILCIMEHKKLPTIKLLEIIIKDGDLVNKEILWISKLSSTNNLKNKFYNFPLLNSP